MRRSLLPVIMLLCFLCLPLVGAVAGEKTPDVTGLRVGEKDTTRLQLRLTGQDSKAQSDKIVDHLQGREERMLRRELREEGEELLAVEEEARIERVRVQKDRAIAEERKVSRERVFEKKKKVQFSTSLDE